ncbi:hypothetical protein BY996DRAFT_6428310 [Phakopsora pachyrhizi]|nr:hypothetical protein BY996DRAFT_6428310 [Phakopsora pachyrhizi]
MKLRSNKEIINQPLPENAAGSLSERSSLLDNFSVHEIMNSDNNKDCLIATLQRQLAAVSMHPDNPENTPFYKRLVKDPRAVGQVAVQLKDNGSNFDDWHCDINSIIQLASPPCVSNFLNDKVHFTVLSENEDLIVQHLLKASAQHEISMQGA